MKSNSLSDSRGCWPRDLTKVPRYVLLLRSDSLYASHSGTNYKIQLKIYKSIVGSECVFVSTSRKVNGMNLAKRDNGGVRDAGTLKCGFARPPARKNTTPATFLFCDFSEALSAHNLVDTAALWMSTDADSCLTRNQRSMSSPSHIHISQNL